MKEFSERTAEKQWQIVAILKANGPMTCPMLAEMTGRKVQNIQNNMYALRKKGMVYVSGYGERPYPNCIPPREWYVGNEPDAKRPPIKTNKQKKADYRKRHAALIQLREHPKVFEKYGMWKGLL